MAPRNRPLVAGALVGTALLIAASAALAQDAVAYGNQADYDAAAGPSDFCLDFTGSTGALVLGGSFSADVTFDSPEAAVATEVNWNSDAISDAGSTTAVNLVGPLGGTFTGTAMAFRLVFSSNANAPTIDLYAEDATLIASLPSPNPSGFFGVVSTVPVKRFVITPGTFADLSPDRFFVDDFCVTIVVAAPPPEEPPATDLVANCHELEAAFVAADPSAFRGRNRQRAFANKLRVVCRRIEAGDCASLSAARQKLSHDILPKTDGERGPKDWVTDATVQQALEDQVNALLADIDAALEALGCNGDDGDDGDDGVDGEDTGGNGGQGHGHGRGRGRGRGHAHGHDK